MDNNGQDNNNHNNNFFVILENLEKVGKHLKISCDKLRGNGMLAFFLIVFFLMQAIAKGTYNLELYFEYKPESVFWGLILANRKIVAYLTDDWSLFAVIIYLTDVIWLLYNYLFDAVKHDDQRIKHNRKCLLPIIAFTILNIAIVSNILDVVNWGMLADDISEYVPLIIISTLAALVIAFIPKVRKDFQEVSEARKNRKINKKTDKQPQENTDGTVANEKSDSTTSDVSAEPIYFDPKHPFVSTIVEDLYRHTCKKREKFQKKIEESNTSGTKKPNIPFFLGFLLSLVLIGAVIFLLVFKRTDVLTGILESIGILNTLTNILKSLSEPLEALIYSIAIPILLSIILFLFSYSFGFNIWVLIIGGKWEPEDEQRVKTITHMIKEFYYQTYVGVLRPFMIIPDFIEVMEEFLFGTDLEERFKKNNKNNIGDNTNGQDK